MHAHGFLHRRYDSAHPNYLHCNRNSMWFVRLLDMASLMAPLMASLLLACGGLKPGCASRGLRPAASLQTSPHLGGEAVHVRSPRSLSLVAIRGRALFRLTAPQPGPGHTVTIPPVTISIPISLSLPAWGNRPIRCVLFVRTSHSTTVPTPSRCDSSQNMSFRLHPSHGHGHGLCLDPCV